MALVGGVASPPLRHANSEGRLHARRRAGSSILGTPGLNPCSSATQFGAQHLDGKVVADLSTSKASAASAAKGLLAALSAKPGAENAGDAFAAIRRDAQKKEKHAKRKDDLSSLHDRFESGLGAAPRVLAAGTGNESKATLPALPELSRGSVRLGSPQTALRPAKRSRSTSGLHDAQKVAAPKSPAEGSTPHKGGACFLPPLKTSQSSGAIAGTQKQNAKSDFELEDLLVTALNGKPAVHKAPLEPSRSIENEAHFEQLMNLLDGKENKSSWPSKKGRRASVSDSHGDNENKILRKGTGFVHLSSASEKAPGRQARILDDRGDNEKGKLRKGTGFVHLSSLLEKERHAQINDLHGDNENGILRKGTGFIHLPEEAPSVSFPDMVDDSVNHIQRQGTGFVFLKHVAPHVRIADSHGDNENRIQRKGTGFIDLKSNDSLPISPGSCSTRTVDSCGPCQDASDTDVASDVCDGSDACEDEEQTSVTDLE